MTSSTPERGPTSSETEIPDKHVPAVEYTDLPEPLPMKKVLGPSVLLLAGAIGSGEYVLWPSIASQVGLVLVWLTILGVGTQYFLNMEIERYTLATGETAVTGFTRLWKPWGILFIFMGVLAWMWPGWATGGTTTLSFALGFSEDAIPYITIGVLVLIGIVLTVSPVVYQTVEKIQFFMVTLIVLFILYAIVTLLGFDGYAELGKRLRRVRRDPGRRRHRGRRRPARSHRVRRSRRGDESRAVQLGPRQGPGHGREAAEGGLAVHRRGGRQADDGLLLPPRRGEHAPLERVVEGREPRAVLDVLRDRCGRVAGLHDADLRHVGVGSDAESFDFIELQGEALQDDQGAWLGTVFWLIGSVVLFSTNLTVVDMIGRLTADALKTTTLRDNDKWSESRLYFITVWAMILFGSMILLSGVDQPLVLLVIAAALNGLVMFVYSILLLQLNRGVLPREIGLRGFRFGGDHLGGGVLRVLLRDPADRPGQAAVRLARRARSPRGRPPGHAGRASPRPASAPGRQSSGAAAGCRWRARPATT